VKHEEIERTGSPDTVRCAPLPDWVEHEPYLLHAPDAGDACIANGVSRLLQDIQIDLSGSDLAWHCRTAQRVLTRVGAERAAHFVAEFDPAFQRLEVHFIHVLRGEECIEHAKPGAVHTFRRETNLEGLMLNGRLTASLLIPDVRVDDIVELSITIYGSNPALGGKCAGWVAFDPFAPWLESRHRLVRPLTREFSVKPFNDPPEPKITVKDGVEETRWCIVGQKRREAEELTPPWLILAPVLQYSEFAAWSDIAGLFAPLYEGGDIPDELAGEIDRLAQAHEAPAERAAEWLRFVQQKLRYFALSFGDGGLIPRGLEAIWNSRFGDCKDAAKLYVAGARRMGLDACAALISTTHGPTLEDLLPSPNVFNHCIVRLHLNGVPYWLDPTLQMQSGDLENIFQPYTGWGLPLTSETACLEKLGGETPLHFLDWEEELCIGPKRGSPSSLRRSVKHFFSAADSVRNSIANEGTAEFSKQMLKELQATWPAVVETEPMQICDDQAKNCLTAILSYEIRDGWKPAEPNGRLGFGIADTVTNRELNPLNGAQRQTDIYLGYPRKITRRMRIEMPRIWAGQGWQRVHKVPGSIGYIDQLSIDGRAIDHSKELVIEAWSVPAAEANGYFQVARQLQENLLTIWARERFGKVRPFGRARVGEIVRIIFALMPFLLLLVSALLIMLR
jgi:hypothetical protein